MRRDKQISHKWGKIRIFQAKNTHKTLKLLINSQEIYANNGEISRHSEWIIIERKVNTQLEAYGSH